MNPGAVREVRSNRPFASMPWQAKQRPVLVKIVFPLAIMAGVTPAGSFSCAAAGAAAIQVRATTSNPSRVRISMSPLLR